MYEAFFSLEDAPFVLTPDPRFLLRAKSHHEILSTLIYGITSQKGLMALIGDVGTGKTILCRALLRDLPKDVRSALVLNPYLSDTELLGTILDDLGVERQGTTKGELMATLSQYLLASGAEGKTVVVILDEAQQMSTQALEQIRILSTLETATRKLLQIVLVGQPELEEMLQRRELRQLDQRIGIRCYLRPLTRKETFRYVEHRLRIAGLPGTLPFARGALMRIYKHSRGIPRVINLVCDRALTVAFSARAREITAPIVKAAITNLEGERRRRRRGVASRPRPSSARGLEPRWVVAVAATLAVLVVLGVAYRTGRGVSVSQLFARSSPPPAAAPVPPAAAIIARPPAGSAPLPRIEGADRNEHDRVKSLVAYVLSLWGVNEELTAQTIHAWPAASDGAPDLPAIASRYQLFATELPDTTLDELRAVDFPAIVELNEGTTRRPYLLRRLESVAATLITPSGEEMRLTADALESSWTHSAWIVWRNVDNLPEDPNAQLTPIVVTTLALRLQKLGLLGPPLPTTNSERFQQAVRRFQASMGLTLDGVVGPRTTLALARVVGGRFVPSLSGGSMGSR